MILQWQISHNSLMFWELSILIKPKWSKLHFIWHLNSYTEHTGDIAVKSELVCRNLKTRLKSLYEKSSRRIIPEINIPELDISITKSSDDNKLFIAVTNRNISQKLKTSIQIFNWEINNTARIYELNGKDYTSLNTFEKPDEVKITESITHTISNLFEYEFPPHSVTIIECQKK